MNSNRQSSPQLEVIAFLYIRKNPILLFKFMITRYFLSKINTSTTIVKDMERFIQFLSSEIHSIPQNEDIILSREEIFEILREFLLS